jgi:hypothetical protein
MEINIKLPRRLRLMGMLLRPTLDRLDGRMLLRAGALSSADGLLPLLESTMGRMEIWSGQLGLAVGALGAVAEDEQASDDAVAAAVLRLEALLEELLILLGDVATYPAQARDVRGRDLAAAVLRHSLHEIRDWLAGLVAVLEHPESAGLRHGRRAGGKWLVASELTLTTAPEMEWFIDWTRERAADAAESAPAPPQAPRQGIGFWAVIGDLLLLFGLIGLFSG